MLQKYGLEPEDVSRMAYLSPRSCAMLEESAMGDASNQELYVPQPQEGKQSEFYHNDTDVVLYGGAAGSGKGQSCVLIFKAIQDGLLTEDDAKAGRFTPEILAAVKGQGDEDSHVLGADGQWIGFSEVEVGMAIAGVRGRQNSIVAVHERGIMPFYKVHFNDKTTVRCSLDHLWKVCAQGGWMVIDTAEISSRIRRGEWIFTPPALLPSFPGAYKRIVDVVRDGYDYCRCITVSNPNRLYITDSYNVTHNSYCMLLDFIKPEYISNPGYRGVIFRRTYPEITSEGGLVDESNDIYGLAGGKYVGKPPTWKFKSGAKVVFRHLQHEDTKESYKGAQFARIGFDELTMFSEETFFYMLSRNRSSSGVPVKCRATTNPDADSWVSQFISWYWHPETGYPIPERSGIVRYFYREKSEVHWGKTKEELIDRFHDRMQPLVEASKGLVTYEDMVKSFAFIAANVYDNPALLRNNPDYLANLNSQHPIERERLLLGNWKIRYEAGLIFNSEWFKIIDAPPMMPRSMVRFWDLAGTSREDAGKDSCSTSGLLMGQIGVNFYILDLEVGQWKAGEIINTIKGCAAKDGTRTLIRWEQEGGGSAKIVEDDFREELLSQNPLYDCDGIKPYGGKLQRALAPATQAQLGHIYIVRGEWNQQFLNAVQSFDGTFKATINDIVDSLSGAYYVLRQGVDYGSTMPEISDEELEHKKQKSEVFTARKGRYI